jgi:uncharacterized protein YjiS (DUF1127 family)
MTDNSTNQPAAVKSKLIKTGLLSQQQQASFQPKAPSLLKQPLSSLNNNILNAQNNNNYYYDQQHYLQAKALQQQQQRQQRHDLNKLSDDALKSDVQIVLNNIQNALLNQQKQQQQQELQQDRFQYLNIFGGQSPPTRGNNGIRQAKNLARKMSVSPADCDNTNNNNMMGPTSMLGCSFASDFTHDNSDYQWFVDYG